MRARVINQRPDNSNGVETPHPSIDAPSNERAPIEGMSASSALDVADGHQEQGLQVYLDVVGTDNDRSNHGRCGCSGGCSWSYRKSDGSQAADDGC